MSKPQVDENAPDDAGIATPAAQAAHDEMKLGKRKGKKAASPKRAARKSQAK